MGYIIAGLGVGVCSEGGWGRGEWKRAYYQGASELLQFGVNCMSVNRNTNSYASYPSCQPWFFH